MTLSARYGLRGGGRQAEKAIWCPGGHGCPETARVPEGENEMEHDDVDKRQGDALGNPHGHPASLSLVERNLDIVAGQAGEGRQTSEERGHGDGTSEKGGTGVEEKFAQVLQGGGAGEEEPSVRTLLPRKSTTVTTIRLTRRGIPCSTTRYRRSILRIGGECIGWPRVCRRPAYGHVSRKLLDSGQVFVLWGNSPVTR